MKDGTIVYIINDMSEFGGTQTILKMKTIGIDTKNGWIKLSNGLSYKRDYLITDTNWLNSLNLPIIDQTEIKTYHKQG